MSDEKMKNPNAVALGRLGGLKGGKARTKAKIAAARKNGKEGGRPAGKTLTEIVPPMSDLMKNPDLSKLVKAMKPKS